MHTIFFALFAGTCLLLLIQAIREPVRIYQFPYFMAAAFGGFILPQAYGILVSGSYPDEWKTPLFAQCFLCVVGCWAGYRRQPKGELVERMRIPVNPGRFAIAGLILTVFGYYFDHKVALLPPDKISNQGTGIYVVYLFFAGQMYTGFAISFYSALIYKKRIYWIMAALALSTPCVSIFVYGRRDPAALLVFTIALVLFFAKGITPPGWLIAGALGLGTLLIPATMSFRQAQAQGQDRFKTLLTVDYKQLFAAYSDPNTTSEVKNAMYLIQAAMSTHIYGFGTVYWNKIVFGFVPAQVVGKPFKDGLMIGNRDYDPENLAGTTGYVRGVGSTITAVGDTFQQFWFFGGLFFAGAAYFFRVLWTSANASDNPIIRVFYIQSMVGCMRSVSHGSAQLLPAMIYSAIFLLFVVVFARQKGAKTETSPHGLGRPIAVRAQ